MNDREVGQVLLVEDNPHDVEVAMRAFRRHRLDARVEVVSNGADALDYLRAAERGERPLPLVVFLDLRMPDVDGIEVVREMRATGASRHVPVVMNSSSRQERDIEASYRSGANSFVVKRFEPERPGEYLIDVARYWLDLNEGVR